jgi:NADH:ubiquinone oxidoreductase subunit F (NADH-binding)
MPRKVIGRQGRALRGRGGAGFPTSKWNHPQTGRMPYIIEPTGDPAFMNRTMLGRSAPCARMLIAA